MSKTLTRTSSVRKHIRPLSDISEEDDERRRDATGRKRVEVVHCLLESSSDEIDNDYIHIEKPSTVLWLTFNEICHIRYVLVQTSLLFDKQHSQIRNGRICFRCRKTINYLYFLPSFLHFHDHETCFICRQTICKQCSYSNFLYPSLKLLMPIRIQTLIKPTTCNNEHKYDNAKTTNTSAKTVCYDCLQLFNEHLNTPHQHLKPSSPSPFRRTNSLPPLPSKTSIDIPKYVRHRRARPLQITNCKIETTTITTTSVMTECS